MNAYFARQPILDTNRNLYGYELLFRANPDLYESGIQGNVDGNRATAAVLDAISIRGLNAVTGGKKAFVNFTEPLLLDGVAAQYSKEHLTVEVLETVRNTNEVLAALTGLKDAGYMIALDDYEYKPGDEALLDMADVIKLEVTGRQEDIIRSIRENTSRIDPAKTALLAEKVETEEMFNLCKELGCKLFQGYFFAKPITLSEKTVSPLRLNHIRLITESSRPGFDFVRISEIIKHDVGLSYKILKLVNSAYFGLSSKVKNVHQATVLLGTKELKKWISYIALTEMCENKPSELIMMSLIRAHFCESIAKVIGRESETEPFFLAGLFSLLDAMLDMEIGVALKNVSLPEVTRLALLENDNAGAWALGLICGIEKGEWNAVQSLADKLPVGSAQVSEIYYETISWGNVIAGEMGDSR